MINTRGGVGEAVSRLGGQVQHLSGQRSDGSSEESRVAPWAPEEMATPRSRGPTAAVTIVAPGAGTRANGEVYGELNKGPEFKAGPSRASRPCRAGSSTGQRSRRARWGPGTGPGDGDIGVSVFACPSARPRTSRTCAPSGNVWFS